MKTLTRIAWSVLALVAIVVAAAYFNLSHIVKHEVEEQGTASLRLTTTLDRASLSLFGGKVRLHGLAIASPKGYSAPHMLEVGDLDIAVRYRNLRTQPMHIASIVVKKPKLVVEQSNGVFNFKKAASLQPSKPASKEPMLLVIDEVKVQDAVVVLKPGLPGLAQEITVPVGSITMKDVGKGKGAKNGAALRDVTMQIASALAAKAAQSGDLPGQLQGLLHLDAGQAVLDSQAAGQVLQNLLGGLKPAGRAP
jgi:uncharacterized protein involved in outer membrane biogenesis